MSQHDLTLLNLNMLYLRFDDRIERESHLPLGPLYLCTALQNAGFSVDFRDYQFADLPALFLPETCADFLEESADIVGISLMANLLPFAILTAREVKRRHPEKTLVLGGVGAKAVEAKILKRFPWIDIVAYGEGERSVPILMEKLLAKADLSSCPGIYYRENGNVSRTGLCERITDLDALPYPAYEKTDMSRYRGAGVLTSRGCPYECSFCSVAPIWQHHACLRSSEGIVDEMTYLKEIGNPTVFLFQDEFFLASPERAKDFSRKLIDSGLDVNWKAFGRINLTDREAMELMAEAGCIQLRFGIESGSDEILARVVKGFTVDEAIRVVADAVDILPSVDTFFIWGYPFEHLEHFYQSVFVMNSFRMMGANVLPSLLCYLPQTKIYTELDRELEFSYDLIPEYMVTGHETCTGTRMRIAPEHMRIYDLVQENPDIFPGFFHYDIENNILPKLEVLREFGYYSSIAAKCGDESCGAHSPAPV
jgi:anaerobic magnesium-protoporphyrin IX monomethyl ester cyclase